MRNWVMRRICSIGLLLLLPLIAWASLVNFSQPLRVSPTGPVSQIRFNPGHYVTIDTGSGGGGPSGWLAQIAADCNLSYLKGFKFASTTTGNDQSVAAYATIQSTAADIAASSITTDGAGGLARVILIALKAKT